MITKKGYVDSVVNSKDNQKYMVSTITQTLLSNVLRQAGVETKVFKEKKHIIFSAFTKPLLIVQVVGSNMRIIADSKEIDLSPIRYGILYGMEKEAANIYKIASLHAGVIKIVENYDVKEWLKEAEKLKSIFN